MVEGETRNRATEPTFEWSILVGKGETNAVGQAAEIMLIVGYVLLAVGHALKLMG